MIFLSRIEQLCWTVVNLLMIPEVCHSSLWRSCPVQYKENYDGTKWQGWELSGSAVWPRLGSSCQILLPTVRLCCLDSLFKAKWLHPTIHTSLFSDLPDISQQSKPLNVGSDFGILKQIKIKNELCQGRLVLRRLEKKHLISQSFTSFQPTLHHEPRKTRFSVWNTLVVTDKYALFWRFIARR